jgi:SRSO17 transposase
MKILLALIITITIGFAQSDKLSNIPPTKSIFIDTNASVCAPVCMKNLLADGDIFTFLSKFKSVAAQLPNLQSDYDHYRRVFRIFNEEDETIKVAILVPQRSIRRYAISTVNSVIAYLLSKQNNFEIKVFNSMDEEEESIVKQLEKIKNEDFTYVIAPVTQKGAEVLIHNSENLLVYIPTIHKTTVQNSPANIIFGGIDYDKQIKKLLKYANNKIAYFSDGSLLTDSLNKSLIKQTPHIIYSKIIESSNVNFKNILKDNKSLNGTSIFMNTPLVKTSLISSQLRVYEIEPYILLSTQLNYNPVLLTLTQYNDIKNLYIANSIGKTSVGLEEINALYGHDIVYDWVNYSTSIGMDYLYTHFFVTTEKKKFTEEVIDDQVNYDISIIRPTRYRFEKELP